MISSYFLKIFLSLDFSPNLENMLNLAGVFDKKEILMPFKTSQLNLPHKSVPHDFYNDGISFT